MQNRREFLGTLGAAVAVGSLRGETLPRGFKPGKVRMRLGVLADIHIADQKQQPYFEKALREFDDWGCDGVLACGDIADYGIKQQLQLAADTWFKVFPNGKGRNGRPVANLMHYGDHDMSEWYLDRPEAKRLLEGQDVEASIISHGNNAAKCWEECFREKYEPITVREVNGYTFILYHFNRFNPPGGNGTPGLGEVMAKLKLDPRQPFFFSQHRPLRNTHYDDSWYDGETGKLFAKYPNLVMFSGHCHIPATEERSIWQGEYNSIQVPSLRYSWTRGGRENSYSGLDRPPIPPFKTLGEMATGGVDHQGLFCSICENALVIKRWNFQNDSSLGDYWVLPYDTFALPPAAKPFNYANRAKTLGIPEFAPGSQVEVKFDHGKDRARNERQYFKVTFPPAMAANGRPMANDYSVRLEAKQAELERIFLEKRVYGRQYVSGYGDADTPVVCPFTTDEVPKGWLLRFSVRPLNTFDGAGAPIVTPWEYRSWGKTAKEAAKEAQEYINGYRKKK